MSLELVMNKKTIKDRHLLLSNYLKEHDIGSLTETEGIFYKRIYELFYIPDKQYTKFDVFKISGISIMKDNYGNKCFNIFVNNTWYPQSIKRLAGGNKNDRVNLIRSFRHAIEPQIEGFRLYTPLYPTDICPVTNKMLGLDAEVDHQIPFHILVEEWLKDNKNVTYSYVLDKFDYILQEPHYTCWIRFHLEKAILRWVSKEGNKFAHKLYV